ncbi:MAG: SHOCT domain-containing protein [Spirochaetia bacterium]|jgi:putative membrane protein
MWGWGMGWGHGGYAFPYWWIGAGLRLVVIAAAVVAVVYVLRHVGRGGWRGHREESALEILQRRYARGEITKEEFEEMKRTLG